DSRRKRSRKRSSPEYSGRINLSATGRCSASSSARYTAPMSPWPISSSTRQPANTAPAGSASGITARSAGRAAGARGGLAGLGRRAAGGGGGDGADGGAGGDTGRAGGGADWAGGRP